MHCGRREVEMKVGVCLAIAVMAVSGVDDRRLR
jgi:hypothetical protein